MLWEVELTPRGPDARRDHVRQELLQLTGRTTTDEIIRSTSHGYIIEAGLTPAEVEELCAHLFADPLVAECRLEPLGQVASTGVTVVLKPGVMDPTAESILRMSRELGLPIQEVKSFRRYYLGRQPTPAESEILFKKIIANEAIEQVVQGVLRAEHLGVGRPYQFQKIVVPLRSLNDDQLMDLSRSGQLALLVEEMRQIQGHYQELGRDPTDCELETIAQTWSEHCSHKTLKSIVEYTEHSATGTIATTHFQNLLKETVFAATQTIRQRLGSDDWCISVFSDNAGVVQFDPDYLLCIKVETHNHPSAIEPYGGANTGLGGVIRDPLGTGLGAKPICNTDVFCFAPPNTPADQLPKGVLHPRRVMQGVVSGVRDYGNRMGIPTVNGAVYFHPQYLANPLVFCGTVGMIPNGKAFKAARPGDKIVAVGGRTGRDGIHGATFSSLELTTESDVVSSGAVQIGNAITEKKVLDVLLQARDRNLFSAITDCGAGGFSSAVGEMAADIGAVVQLEQAPLKYDGLSYTDIWISESQERMVLAVPPEQWPALEALCRSEDVEAAILGEFTDTGRLQLSYHGQPVADMDLHFLHEGRPKTVRKAAYYERPQQALTGVPTLDLTQSLLQILSDYSVCSKEWIIRQYDHEVQGGSVIKPLVGVHEDGPGNASVVMPVLGKYSGFAVGCGLNPHYAAIDPYQAAACAIDEAIRNVVSVGGDPARTAILDNFCWGNVHDPVIFGDLVRTAIACRDVAVAMGTPFVSGKDSLNNTYADATGARISIPSTLLVTAMAAVHDVRKCVTMDLKTVGNHLLLVGETRAELGQSFYSKVNKLTGG
ncbi:MAG: AIR synthase-related protein, partial [Gemmataceae bacterium]